MRLRVTVLRGKPSVICMIKMSTNQHKLTQIKVFPFLKYFWNISRLAKQTTLYPIGKDLPNKQTLTNKQTHSDDIKIHANTRGSSQVCPLLTYKLMNPLHTINPNGTETKCAIRHDIPC